MKLFHPSQRKSSPLYPVLLISLGLGGLACETSQTPLRVQDTPVWQKSAEGRDVYRHCYVRALSGAHTDLDRGNQLVLLAEWLSASIESELGKEIMLALASSRPEKGELLKGYARSYGLKACPTALEWVEAENSAQVDTEK